MPFPSTLDACPTILKPIMVIPAAAVEQPARIKGKRLPIRPSLRSLSLTTLPAYLSPFPLPSQLSDRLCGLCDSGDQQLRSLVDRLQSKELDVDDWQRRLWRRVTDDIEPAYQHAFNSVDMGAMDERLQAEKRERGWSSSISLTYGEITLASLACILARHTRLSDHTVFADVGSGIGRGLIAALMCHRFERCIGVELLHSLHDQALLVKAAYEQTSAGQSAAGSELQLICGDFRTCSEWQCADVVYVNSTCFDRLLMAELSAACERLPLGATVVTQTHRLSSDWFICSGVGSYEMSWGSADIFVHCKVQPSRPPT